MSGLDRQGDGLSRPVLPRLVEHAEKANPAIPEKPEESAKCERVEGNVIVTSVESTLKEVVGDP